MFCSLTLSKIARLSITYFYCWCRVLHSLWKQSEIIWKREMSLCLLCIPVTWFRVCGRIPTSVLTTSLGSTQNLRPHANAAKQCWALKTLLEVTRSHTQKWVPGTLLGVKQNLTWYMQMQQVQNLFTINLTHCMHIRQGYWIPTTLLG